MVSSKTKLLKCQFTVRSLFALVTALAAAFAWVGWRIEYCRRQWHVRDRVEAFGGEVLLERGLPKWLADILGEETSNVVVGVYMPQHTDDNAMAELQGLTRLRELVIRNTLVTDLGLAYVREFTQLEVLDASDTQITTTGLQYIKGCRRLRELALDGPSVSVVHMRGRNTLEQLS